MSDANVRKALADLVAAIDLVHASPEYRSVYETAQNHQRHPYSGPKYADELERARAVLAVSP